MEKLLILDSIIKLPLVHVEIEFVRVERLGILYALSFLFLHDCYKTRISSDVISYPFLI